MEKMTYRLTTLSSLIISPRAGEALYKELEDFSLGKIKDGTSYLEKTKLKVIYPFYRYGEYSAYTPESAEYYLPGTSVKGALRQGNATPSSFMVDDVPIPNDSVVLRNIHKAQHLKNEEKACFVVFYENVGVEMIKDKTELKGDFYIGDRKLAETLFKAANESTRFKLSQMLAYLCDLVERKYSQKLRNELRDVIDKMTPLLEDRNILLLGGYKGLLHSMEFKESQREIDGAVYLDPETMLPHGLVRMVLI